MPTLMRTLHLLTHPAELKARLEARRALREPARQFARWQKNESPRLERFRNLHQGESCFIIGNGPSLNKMDLALLNEHTSFGLNKIYMLFKRTGLHIDYHVAVNKLVVEQAATEFAKLNCPSFLSYTAAEGVVEPADNLYYTYSTLPYGFYEDITKGMAEGATVTFVATQIAYFMGFKKVFLIGVDHSFKAKGKPHEKQLLTAEDQNHFDPNYFKGNEWQLPDLDGSELAFRIADFQYRSTGRAIYDATVGGKLEIFPKISFEQALERCAAS